MPQKDYISRHNFWYRALNDACKKAIQDPDGVDGPDAALFLGALMSVQPHREDKLPRNWMKFANTHSRDANKIRMAASRFILLDGPELHIDLPTDGTVPKVKKYLAFREPTQKELGDYEDMVKNPGLWQQRQRELEAEAQREREMAEQDSNGASADEEYTDAREGVDDDASTGGVEEDADACDEDVNTGREDVDAGSEDSDDGDADGDEENGNVVSCKRAAPCGLRQPQVKRQRAVVVPNDDKDIDKVATEDDGVYAEQTGQNQEGILAAPISQPVDSDMIETPAAQPLGISFAFETSTVNSVDDQRKLTMQEYLNAREKYLKGEGEYIDTLIAEELSAPKENQPQ